MYTFLNYIVLQVMRVFYLSPNIMKLLLCVNRTWKSTGLHHVRPSHLKTSVFWRPVERNQPIWWSSTANQHHMLQIFSLNLNSLALNNANLLICGDFNYHVDNLTSSGTQHLLDLQNLKRVDIDSLCHDMRECKKLQRKSDDIEMAVQQYHSSLRSILDKHAPIDVELLSWWIQSGNYWGN